MGRRRKPPSREVKVDKTNVPLANAGDLIHTQDIVFPGTGYGTHEGMTNIVAVVPFYKKEHAKFRHLHLEVVVKSLLKNGVRVVLVSQNESAQIEVPETGWFREEVIAFDDDFHKSALINHGIDIAITSIPDWDWLFQCDADLLCSVEAIVTALRNIPSDVTHFQPWKNWIRLTEGESSVVRDFPEPSREYLEVLPRRVNHGFCAGGLMLRKDILVDGFRWNESFKNWGWEDAWVANELRKLYKHKFFRIETCSAVHLWHENDRVIQYENGERFYDGPIPMHSRAGVMLEGKTKYLIVSQGRSGGNLFGRALDLHPDVACDSSEPFQHVDPDPPVENNNIGMRVWTFEGPLNLDKPVVGMRVQYGHTKGGYKFTVQEYVEWAYEQGFKLIHLVREDAVAKIASNKLALASGNWISHPYPDATYTLEPKAFVRAVKWSREQMAMWRDLFAKFANPYELTYEDLCSDWDGQMAEAFRYLGVRPLPVEQPIQKQARKPYWEYIENWMEVKGAIDHETT